MPFAGIAIEHQDARLRLPEVEVLAIARDGVRIGTGAQRLLRKEASVLPLSDAKAERLVRLQILDEITQLVQVSDGDPVGAPLIDIRG